MEEYPIHGQPDYSLPNSGNPYTENKEGSQRGEPYMTDLAGKSTMVSDSVQMTKRMKLFVPKSSVMKADLPKSVVGNEPEVDNYKSKYQ